MPAATEPQATAGGEHTSRLALRLSRAHFIPPARWSRSAGGHHLGDERDQLGIPGLPSWRIATTVRLLSGAPFLLKSVARPRRNRSELSGLALGRRRADCTLDGRKKRVEPDRFHHAAMALAALARQFRQITAHDESLGAKIGGAIGNDRAVAIRQPPIGDDERIALRREARPGFGRGRRHIDLISGIRQRQGQQLADILVVLNQQDALFRHQDLPRNGGLTTVSAGRFRWGYVGASKPASRRPRRRAAIWVARPPPRPPRPWQ